MRHVYQLIVNALSVDKKFVTYIVQTLRKIYQKDTVKHALKKRVETKKEKRNSLGITVKLY